MENELLEACTSGNADDLFELIKKGADATFQDSEGRSPLMLAAAGGHSEIIQKLLEAGAPWNAIDKQGQCAGEYAMEEGHQEAFDILLDAGVRAELLLGAVERATGRGEEKSDSASYLDQTLQYGKGEDGSSVLLDQQQAVMMEWERPLMQAHAQVVCTGRGDVLNVGFGLGIVDEAIQACNPRSHTIIEAHPDVYKRDSLEQLGKYDGIFFDTYSEFYEDLREFHGHLPKLLRKGGLYSYFNGLAADNPFFYLVYRELCKLELARLGLATQFISLPINVSNKDIWRKVGNRYWQLDTYLLPVAEWENDNE